MIGKIVKIRTPYYDRLSKTTKFKLRPGLVIGNYGLTDSDYIVLPVSKVSDKRMRHPKYDLEIYPKDFPLSNLKVYSFIRCHTHTSLIFAIHTEFSPLFHLQMLYKNQPDY